MPGFEFKALSLQGAYLIQDFFSGDNRGGFTKSFEKDIFAVAGIKFSLNETFVSHSMKNVIRGLHFQLHEPQAKLVSVVHGAAWDVIVDLRVDSPTFAQWYAQILSAENHRSFFIPRGFAHGFASLADETVMMYQCDGRYDKVTDMGIRFDDPDLAIAWPLDLNQTIHSQRDLRLMSLKDYSNLVKL